MGFHKKEVAKIDSMIRRMVIGNHDVHILTSIPSVGLQVALEFMRDKASSDNCEQS